MPQMKNQKIKRLNSFLCFTVAERPGVNEKMLYPKPSGSWILRQDWYTASMRDAMTSRLLTAGCARLRRLPVSRPKLLLRSLRSRLESSRARLITLQQILIERSRRGSRVNLLGFSNNLVHSLARKLKFVSNITQRFAINMQRHNLIVAICIRCRPWTQRAPLPTWNTFKFFDFSGRKLSPAAALADVTGPGPQWVVRTINALHVGGRNEAVPLPLEVGINGLDRQVESRNVVHGPDISKR